MGERSVCLGSEGSRVVTNNGFRLVFSALKRSIHRDHGLENLIGGEMLIDLVDADFGHRCTPVNLVDHEPKEFEIWVAVGADIVNEVDGF